MRSSPNARFVRCLAGLLAICASPALAQYYRAYPDDYDRPRGIYADPRGAEDEDNDRPSRRRRQWRRGEFDDGSDERRAPRRAAPQSGARLAALPPDADPAYSTPVDYDSVVDPRQSRRRYVVDPTNEPPGTISIVTQARKMYFSFGQGRAIEYDIGVGRQGFAWKGEAQVGRKAFWPGWTPPPEMLERRPDLPPHMDGGLDNPLGARALYLFKGVKDTLFRIHGTNEPDTIGRAVSSGCIRMLNADVIDLYQRVAKGARVVVR